MSQNLSRGTTVEVHKFEHEKAETSLAIPEQTYTSFSSFLNNVHFSAQTKFRLGLPWFELKLKKCKV